MNVVFNIVSKRVADAALGLGMTHRHSRCSKISAFGPHFLGFFLVFSTFLIQTPITKNTRVFVVLCCITSAFSHALHIVREYKLFPTTQISKKEIIFIFLTTWRVEKNAYVLQHTKLPLLLTHIYPCLCFLGGDISIPVLISYDVTSAHL